MLIGTIISIQRHTGNKIMTIDFASISKNAPKLELVYAQLDSNWDIFKNDDNYLFAIAKPETGASNSHMGSRDHIVGLMRRKFFDFDKVVFTEAGLELMSGLSSHSVYNNRISKDTCIYRIAHV